MALYKGKQMIAGAGKTPAVAVNSSNKHLIIDGVDTGVKVEGDKVSVIDGYIAVNGVKTTAKVVSSYDDLSNKPNISNANKVTYTSSPNASQLRNMTISTAEPTTSEISAMANGDIWIVVE